MDIRQALPSDAQGISELLREYARKAMLLPRGAEEIMENIRDFVVAVEGGRLLGSCALKIYDDTLGEIRSLAVAETGKGRGYGKALMAKCEEDAVRFGLQSLFALTYIPDFFTHSGYREVDKESLPQKIWRDCCTCINFPNCTEVAVLKRLHSSP